MKWKVWWEARGRLRMMWIQVVERDKRECESKWKDQCRSEKWGKLLWEAASQPLSKWGKLLYICCCFLYCTVCNNTTWAAVLYQIYKHEPKASGCISYTTRTQMLYIAYDTPTSTSKCSCLSTILKIKAILVKYINH